MLTYRFVAYMEAYFSRPIKFIHALIYLGIVTLVLEGSLVQVGTPQLSTTLSAKVINRAEHFKNFCPNSIR